MVRAVVVIGLCLSVPLSLVYVIQDRFVYGPDPSLPPVESVLPGGQEVTYAAADGTVERAWFVPARNAPRGITIVAFHGYNGNRAGMADIGNQLADRGFAVLLAEYRGYGGMSGRPSEDGLRQDALAAHAYIRARPDVDASKIVYLGYSLGTGVAVTLTQSSPPAALVLMAPYTSLPDVAWSRLPGLPYQLLMRSRFDSLSRIGNIRVPLLVIRGENDHLVPPEQSQRVFDAANQPKQLLTIPGADHDLQGPTGPSPSDAISTFLQPTPPR